MISNTTNTRTSKIERAVPSIIYSEAEILRDILSDLNHQAEHDIHRSMEDILTASPYNAKWKRIIGFEGRRFVPAIKIERRKNKINNKNN